MKFTLPSIKCITTYTLLLSIVIFISCADPVDPINGIDGLDGFNALVDIQTETEGNNCSEGGLKISVGQDDNANGILDESEIESISYVCNGSAGSDGSTPSSLIARTSPEEPGDNCNAGGTLIEIGNDSNNNGSLESAEVLSSFFLCNGTDGADGSDGTDGSNGTDGTDGTDGVDGLDGFSSIIKATAEPSGDNCSSGGLKIEIGLDSNGDQELNSDEIQSTYYLCNGVNGTDGTNGSNGTDGIDGLTTLSNVISEPAGTNCANGGFKIEVGIDSNSNSVLDASEVSSENYVCNGTDGEDGNNGSSSLIRISTEESGDNCSNGGMKIEVGLDDSILNGELDDDEIDFTQYVCGGLNGTDGTNGANGLNSIIQTTTIEPGGDCSNGGIEIQVGLDTNGNSQLDEGEEIGGSFYVCNGVDGADGNNGLDGADGTNGTDGRDVIVISSAASTCANGGSTLEFGYDGNNDGDLSDVEDTMLTTITICNGIDGTDGSDGADGTNGYNTIIITETEEPGDNCANGGLALNVGLDINGNNQIDIGEERGTFYVCNGSDGNDGSDGTNGNNSLITVTSFSGNQNGCLDGGLTIRTGIDDNGNGVLNLAEIDATSYVCNGSDGTDGTDGSDGADGNSDNIFEFYFQEGFDGYTGVIDLSISDKNGNEGGNTFSVDKASGSESHGLLQFPDLDKMAETIGTSEFEIVEAILYLKGRSVRVDGENADNWIGVRTITGSVPLFDPDAVSWTSIDGNQAWSEPGVTSNSNLGDANDYSDMYRLPNDIVFNGYIPLLLKKSEVEIMTDKTTNKGLVLLMANDGVPYELDIISSDNKNEGAEGDRPLLYIKTKITSGRGRTQLSHQEQKNIWDQMSYEQKLAPLRRKK